MVEEVVGRAFSAIVATPSEADSKAAWTAIGRKDEDVDQKMRTHSRYRPLNARYEIAPVIAKSFDAWPLSGCLLFTRLWKLVTAGKATPVVE